VNSHLQDVAKRAAEYARSFGAGKEAEAAGLLHDIGKYGELFAKRLEGEAHGVDHWTAGAWILLQKYKHLGIASALAVQGHHIGLQQGTKDALVQLDPGRGMAGSTIGMDDMELRSLVDRFEGDGLVLPEDIGDSVYLWSDVRDAADMLDVRMLFSTLVDADFMETEAHFAAETPRDKKYRPEGPSLNPDKALKMVLDYIKQLAATSDASEHINQIRADLLDCCLDSAEMDPGLFTLTAPTGSGKTLSMLAFALKHAHLFYMRRIVVVIPYLTIIEQTVGSYRKALAALGDEEFLRTFVLENHSLAGTKSNDEGKIDNEERLLAENWDAPIVVTTSVQFLESLFSNRPSACRKLHRLASSVILFDEVQTLPVRLLIPTLATLSHLSERYGATVVFSTATQPAFGHLHQSVLEQCNRGWQPREIVPKELELAKRASRTRVVWPREEERLSFDELATAISKHRQVLAIVNVKRHAIELLDRMANTNGLMHLSTSMCPAHRTVVLEEVRKRLDKGMPCRLISTQCVEAGVDLDFPVVYRAWGPLESITQAAGRCNRHGNMEKGVVYVFRSTDGGAYPDAAYQQAANVAELVLRQNGANMDLSDETVFQEYYRLLYSIARPEIQYPDLATAIKIQDFQRVAELYRVIPQDFINVLVPYDPDVYTVLADEVRDTGLNRAWIQQARPYTVGEFRPRKDNPLLDWIEPVPIGHSGDNAHDWYIYLGPHYDQLKGLQPQDSPGFFHR